jgi:hypothetical protein
MIDQYVTDHFPPAPCVSYSPRIAAMPDSAPWELPLESATLDGPLAYPDCTRPEWGPSADRYFAEKHRRGVFGRFYPSHVTRYSDRRRGA